MAATGSSSFENEYSRLLGAIGAEALKRLQASSVLLVGLRGLGVEIAKNLVLFGVNKLTIHDPLPVGTSDLSSNFFLRTEDLGKSRAASVFEALHELNPRVDLRVSTFEELDAAALQQFTAVVSTDNRSLTELTRISTVCHENLVKFIAVDSRGLFGAIFTDFVQHVIFDKNGEPPKSAYLATISNENPGIVLCNDGERHDLEDGDWITLNEVEGMTEVNGQEFQVRVISPMAFSIGDTSDYGVYQARGLMNEVKKPITHAYQPLSSHFAKFTYGKASHPDGEKAALSTDQFLWYYKTLLAYQERHDGACPRPYDRAGLADFLELAASLKPEAANDIDRALFRKLFYTSSGDLSPMAAFLGGVAAQEVCKAVTGKYLPIDQFLFYDALDTLEIPDADDAIDTTLYAARGTRYDGQAAVYGSPFCEKLANLRYFLVGSGAIGCEMLKNWAMMGIGTGPEGQVIVTDMDTIEVSNLNRQFLFRANNVGQFKSEVAAAAATRMNPELKVEARTQRIAKETAQVFNEAFWSGLSGVCNALDNVEARIYVDQQCVRYGKSLLESGTLGPKGNTQVIVPQLTESYASSVDPPQTGIPLCTLHTFPSKIEHTLTWARQIVFQELFCDRMEHARKFFAEGAGYLATIKDIQRLSVVQGLEKDVLRRPANLKECVQWAVATFYEYYRDAPMSLLSAFPRDYVDKNGARFWTGSKRAPTPLAFDPSNRDHCDFILSAASLRAWCFNLTSDEFKPADLAALETEILPVACAYVPAAWVKGSLVLDEKSAEGANKDASLDDEQAYIDAAVAKLKAVQSFTINVVEFEKDDDRNWHIDFVNAASNLRALCYEIPTVGRLQSKLIAGKIIPAMITTTAAVAGLVCFELYKLFATPARRLDQYFNVFMSLAVGSFQAGNPMPSPVVGQFRGKPFGIWDHIDIQGNLTFQQFMDHFLNLGIEIDTVAVGQAILWASFIPSAKKTDRKNRTIAEVVCEVCNIPIESLEPVLQITIMGADAETGDDVDATPDIYLHWRK